MYVEELLLLPVFTDQCFLVGHIQKVFIGDPIYVQPPSNRSNQAWEDLFPSRFPRLLLSYIASDDEIQKGRAMFPCKVSKLLDPFPTLSRTYIPTALVISA